MPNESRIERELVITRKFDAPRSFVFMCGQRRSTSSAGGDLRISSAWKRASICGRGRLERLHALARRQGLPGGRRLSRDQETERLVFTFAWEEIEEQPTHEMLITVSFEEVGGKTLMTFRQGPFLDEITLESHTDGWSTCFDRIEAYLASLPLAE